MSKLLQRMSASRSLGREKNSQASLMRYRGVSTNWLREFWRIIESKELMPKEEVLVGTGSDGGAPFRPKKREDWTVQEVLQQVVVPTLRQEKKGFFVELLGHEEVGKQFEGAFLSVPRQAKFKDIVLAITQEKLTFVWLDVFCANQSVLSELAKDFQIQRERSKFLKTSLQTTLARFEQCLFFLDAGQRPKLLQDAMCLWELFNALEVKAARTKIIMAPGQVLHSMSMLQKHGISLFRDELDASFNPAHATYSNRSDVAIIRDTVENDESIGGWICVKRAIAKKIMLFFAESGEQLVDTMEEKLDGQELAEFLLNVGELKEHIGCSKEAMAFCDASLQIQESLANGQPNRSLVRTLLAISRLSLSSESFSAMHFAERALEALTESNLEGDVDLLVEVHLMLAKSLVAQGEFEQALETVFSMLDKSSVAQREDIQASLKSFIGMCYQEQGMLAPAMTKFEEALRHYKKADKQGADPNQSSLLASMAQICLLRAESDLNNFDKAKDFAERSIAKLESPEDLRSIEPRQILAIVANFQGQHKQAVQLMEKNMKISADDEHNLALLKFQTISMVKGQGQLEKALAIAKEAYNTLSRLEPAASELLASCKKQLDELQA